MLLRNRAVDRRRIGEWALWRYRDIGAYPSFDIWYSTDGMGRVLCREKQMDDGLGGCLNIEHLT